jgi:hypothetical protein
MQSSRSIERIKKRSPKPRKPKMSEDEKLFRKVRNMNLSYKHKLEQSIISSEGKEIISFSDNFYFHAFAENIKLEDCCREEKGLVVIGEQDMERFFHMLLLKFQCSDVYPEFNFSWVVSISRSINGSDPEIKPNECMDIVSSCTGYKKIYYLYRIELSK